MTPYLAPLVNWATKHGPENTLESVSAIPKLEYVRLKMHANHSFLPLRFLSLEAWIVSSSLHMQRRGISNK